MKKLIQLSSLLVITCLILGSGAWAQEGFDEFTLEEVTVTAQKRAENQQKVDIAMEVLTSESLKEMGRTSIDDILSTVSTAIIARYNDGMRVTLRGISDDNTSHIDMAASAPTVAINVDGIRSNRKDKASSLFDLERVEVLYGPQSTLYSSNSPGGIVNVITAKPKLDTLEASGSIEIGNYSLIHTEGMMNMPVTDTIAMRAAFSTEDRDGYFSNGADDADNKAARFRTLYQPTDNFSVMLTAYAKRVDGSGSISTVDAFVDQDDVANPWETTYIGTTEPGSRHERNQEFSGEANWTTRFGTVTMLANYSEGNITSATHEEAEFTKYSHDNEEKGAEIRMASDPDFFLKWVVGYNYYEQTDSGIQNSVYSGSFADKHLDETAQALFLNISYPIIDQLRLLGGYRLSEDNMYITSVEGRPDATGTFGIQGADKTANYERPDYKLGFEYDLGSESMIYANYSTSYRVNGWSGPPKYVKVLPELLKAYTVGSKNRFFGNKLQVNGAAYYYDYRNYSARERREPWFDYNGNGAVDFGETPREHNQQGIGAGVIWGIDLQISAIITPQDVLNLSWAHLDSKWDDLSYEFEYHETDVFDADGNVIRVQYADVDYTGTPMSNSPPDTFTLNYSHNFILSNGASLKANLTTRYQTEYRLYWGETTICYALAQPAYPLCNQEAYHMSDFSLVYTPNDKWSLSLWVKNMENYAVKRMFWEAGPGGGWKMNIGTPRTYGAILGMKF